MFEINIATIKSGVGVTLKGDNQEALSGLLRATVSIINRIAVPGKEGVVAAAYILSLANEFSLNKQPNDGKE